jgi:hypothetical protein
MEQHTHEPQPPVLSNVEGPALPTIRSYATRHDGWTGEKMAIFCETLAETAVVAEACDQAGMGISGAYAARRRNPVFAAAWDAALTIARERLADTLLARSMEGNVEQIWRDGVVVGERHLLDNKLGLALLRRLDRLAETGLSLHSNPAPSPGTKRSAPAILPRHQSIDWNLAMDAFRTGDDECAAMALAIVKGPALSLTKGHEVDEVEDPLNRPPSDDEDDTLDLTDRCWWSADDQCWHTDFPPPAGFTGYESCDYHDLEDPDPYFRGCTEEETAILDANRELEQAAERAEEEALRDDWFACLREEAVRSKD